MNRVISRATALFVCLAATAIFMANARTAEPVIERTMFEHFPMTLGSWNAVNDPPIEDELLEVLGVDDYLSRIYYRTDGAAVGLYMGFYGSQRQGDTIHSPLNCLPGAGWHPLQEGRVTIPDVGGPGMDIEVNRYIVQKGLDRQLVLYWYQSNGRVEASEYRSRLYLIHNAIRLNRTDGSLVRVIAPIPIGAQDNGAGAEQLAIEFVRTLFPTLPGFLPS